MAKNTDFTMLDTNQIINRKFDPMNDADRVYLVGGADLNISINEDKLVNAIKDGLSLIKFEKVQETVPTVPLYREIQTPQIEYRTLEVPTIIKEIEYRTIEIPVITERIVTIEKPIVIKEIEIKEIIRERHYPTILKVCAVIQAIAVIAILIINLLKK